MKTAVVYYSYTGRTRALAEAAASAEAADLAEIKDKKRPGKFKAYTAGIFSSIRGKAWPIQPLGLDLSGYERIILMSPVWAGSPPPAVNAFLEALSGGKTVEVRMVSASGESSCRERVEAKLKARGCSFAGFADIKG